MRQKTLLTRLMFLLLVLVGGIGTVRADEASYTATDTDKPTATNGTTTKTLSGTNSVSWSLSVTQNTKSSKSPYVSYDKTNSYWQLGSSNSPCTAFWISTSGITGTITKVEVITGSANASSKINVSVGGSAFGTQNQSTGSGSTLATQTFTGSASGEIIVSATASSAAFYFKSVKVTYTSAALSSIAVTTPPTTIDYKVGEAFSSDGMVVMGTYSDASTKAISGYTMAIGETALSDGDVLNSAGSKTVTITYDGKTCTQDITVHALSSISLSGTYPTSFTEKDEFSHEGLVVTANYDDNSTKEVTSEVTFSGYDMNTVGQQTVTVSYAPYEGATPVTTEYNITVNAGTKYTVTFDAQTGTCEPASLTENVYQGGVVLPSATCSKSGWVFAGWAEAAVTNTTTKPALYEAGDTYYPTEPKTLYAVYKLDGIDDSKYKRATTVSDVMSAGSIVVVSSGKVLTNDFSIINAPSETDNMIEVSNSIIWNMTGNNTDGYTLTNNNITIGANGLSNAQLANTTSNSLWILEASNITDCFVLRNTNSTNNGCIEYYSSESKWKLYTSGSSFNYKGSSYVALKLYIPVENAYNSNPAGAIINPVVEFEKEGTTLYLDGTTNYTNAATVTGINKTATYASSDESVATVDANGNVTAVGIGTATITASVAQELGVNNAASATYEIVVKNATTIAGIKNITDAKDAVNFAADLTDAVVTYVKDGHAYIQDATAAIYASCGSDLTVGQKINGAVSGSVKAAYKIDEITSIDLDEATVTNDGAIPTAEVKTLAEIKAAGTGYDGKLVTVNTATVSSSMENTDNRGASISDDNGTTSFNLYAPNKGITVNASEIGNFTGFVSIYVSGENSTYRLNLYEQSQIELTQNAAREQELSFDEDAIVLDEETTEFDNFIGQAVNGAQGTVTYTISGDAIGTVDNDGFVELNGTCGTATVTATAAAITKEVDGIPTPYKAATKSYSITVRPRYSVAFYVNGVEEIRREASYGAGVTAPTPAQIGEYSFVGWSSAEVEATDEEPTMVTVAKPSSNDEKYYAVFAKETIGNPEQVTLASNTGSITTDGIIFSGTTNSSNGNSAPSFNLNKTLTISDIDLTDYSDVSISFDYKVGKSGSTYTTFNVEQFNSSNSSIGNTPVTGTNNNGWDKSNVSLNTACVKIVITSSGYTSNCYIDNIVITGTRPSITYTGYTTDIIESITLSDASDYTPVVGRANVTLGRSFVAGWNGIMLPFELTEAVMTALGATEVKTLSSTTVNGNSVTLNFTDVTLPVAASTPVMVKLTAAKNAEEVVISDVRLSDASPKEAEFDAEGTDFYSTFTMKGTYETVDETDNELYFVSNTKFYHKAGGVSLSIKPFRSYIVQETIGNNARSINFNFEDNVSTGIISLTNQQEKGHTYDLQGRRVNIPAKGMYINNGKKIIIK